MGAYGFVLRGEEAAFCAAWTGVLACAALRDEAASQGSKGRAGSTDPTHDGETVMD